MTNKINFKDIIFDDVTDADEGLKLWSQICQSCVDKHNIDSKCLDEGTGHGICGVEGCDNESDHYIDFPDDEITILDEINKYIETTGASMDGEWLLQLKRQNQVKELIKNGYNLCDFDRWQQIQDILFGNDYEELDWESSQKIIDILWEKDIEVLDLWSFKDNMQ